MVNHGLTDALNACDIRTIKRINVNLAPGATTKRFRPALRFRTVIFFAPSG
jgi:hypothetical protein